MTTTPHQQFRAARDLLLASRTDYETARSSFVWPRPRAFNWASDWFDTIAGEAGTAERVALWITDADGTDSRYTYADLSERSDQVACWLRDLGLRRGDHAVVMLGNQVELWETMLAAMKLGVVVIPATPLLAADDLRDRVTRGRARAVIADAVDADKVRAVVSDEILIAVGGSVSGWSSFADSHRADRDLGDVGETLAGDPLLLYFTSGTTSLPKLVEHSHLSYPVGHLTTMYWLGVEQDDVHLNISSPGWGKWAWSNFFGPWNAGATVFVWNYDRLDAASLLAQMQRVGVTSFCAPPTVWRMLIQSDLGVLEAPPAKVRGAGEPLNPEVISRIASAWGAEIRDGFGQTETTCLVGNSPGQPVTPGSMGRPMPGYDVVLLDANGEEAEQGELSLRLGAEHPVGLMTGYRGDAELTAASTHGGFYRTGDIASRDADGYLTYVGRADDVFKSSDYRISPFELESVLLRHDAVAEAAVVPSPHPVKLSVPKAYVTLTAAATGDSRTAADIFRHSRASTTSSGSRRRRDPHRSGRPRHRPPLDPTRDPQGVHDAQRRSHRALHTGHPAPNRVSVWTRWVRRWCPTRYRSATV